MEIEIERNLVMPGDVVPCPTGSMPGYGTYQNEVGEIVSNVMGYPAMYNRLVCVNSLRGCYIGETGNVVIGRISQVGNKRWKVDIGASQEAALQLSSIDLPTGEHRIRSEEDQLHMREYFNHNDLLSAEVQSKSQEGKAINLQTRSSKFGKLKNGMLVVVSPNLVARMRQHFCQLNNEVDIIFGRNGWIWVYYNNTNELEVPLIRRQQIVRISCLLKLMNKALVMISPEKIQQVFERTSDIELEDLLAESTLERIKDIDAVE
ncbi:EXOSC2 [Blepharisma stoltei]|uniref:S1 motif domain-containing protein n=1 Tax=Blepharisma stoltei TaxID=1481888 RepID=A0AAU9KGV7_9CILI|nr:unnamed protein product [Blepharisma stoltei]